jgi:hypothetical protein
MTVITLGSTMLVVLLSLLPLKKLKINRKCSQIHNFVLKFIFIQGVAKLTYSKSGVL